MRLACSIYRPSLTSTLRIYIGHREEVQSNEDIRIGDLSTDLSCGREAVMVSCEDRNGLEAFTYISRVIDSDKCTMAAGPRDLSVCCDCEDICTDPQTCACLRQVRFGILSSHFSSTLLLFLAEVDR